MLTPRLNYEANVIYSEALDGDLKKPLYRKRKDNEDELNATTISEAYGKPVKLGDMVQIFHPQTNSYVEINIVNGDAGSHNLMTLTKRMSNAIQFKIASPLTFRKKGSVITLGDDLYFASDKDRTLAYPTNNSIKEQLVMNFSNKLSKRNWIGDSKKEVNKMKLPNLTETQSLFLPIQAGNIALNFVGVDYGNIFRMSSLNIKKEPDSQNDNFRWGDQIFI